MDLEQQAGAERALLLQQAKAVLQQFQRGKVKKKTRRKKETALDVAPAPTLSTATTHNG